MEKRRIHFSISVTYQTTPEKLKKIDSIIKDIFKKIELARLDRVNFKQFGQSSLDFEIAYYVDSGDYNKYMDVQEEINFAIFEKFKKEKIEFAYPTRTIHMQK